MKTQSYIQKALINYSRFVIFKLYQGHKERHTNEGLSCEKKIVMNLDVLDIVG